MLYIKYIPWYSPGATSAPHPTIVRVGDLSSRAERDDRQSEPSTARDTRHCPPSQWSVSSVPSHPGTCDVGKSWGSLQLCNFPRSSGLVLVFWSVSFCIVQRLMSLSGRPKSDWLSTSANWRQSALYWLPTTANTSISAQSLWRSEASRGVDRCPVRSCDSYGSHD